ncbi:SMP-30/gluconolactonase/LRE family protein [Pelomonas sp. SE-A7]|uniref:SMP-30/gluconolactonase/LRE family protein n=1 Tax=Pelomonas sp. SE-A7 TaxID=3054953 RepID=UPI00259C6E26|nr:SMP-30/gluconolactonase/LRE family protein [Pelomonas sp. SE-A7]MDM4768119.1 SMP-30/gluconolactonase/LRE family protein [Pelomonas sp. SE-A7]
MNELLIECAGAAPARLGESPLWCEAEQALYYVDIAAHQVLRLAADGALRSWQLEAEPGCIALAEQGGLLVARRDGLWHLDTATGGSRQLGAPPFDPAKQRFNDGKPDAAGRFWIGTIDDARQPEAALYRWADGGFQRMAEGITNSNGLAWSPDQGTMYWTDTKAHEIYAFDFDPATGAIANRRRFARFPARVAGEPLESYGGRPDGATVDAEGCLWVAMYEGARIVRLSPAGELLQAVRLPVRCPTMPAFGGPDLKTLYITTARDGRPTDELAREPFAGCVLKVQLPVCGFAPRPARG